MTRGTGTSVTPGCKLCPRRCGSDRLKGEVGKCGAGSSLRVARAALHHWEEPPISGWRGSGTVFFSHCPLRCVYCQNHEISLEGFGADITVEQLAESFLELQSQGAHNINLVTATHYANEAIAALGLARAAGLSLPVVWNSSGYETVETVQMLEGTVDAWLLDYRYASPAVAERYSKAPDYPEVASAALAAALGQTGEYRLDTDGLLASGILVRFLLLPGQLDEAIACVDRVYEIAGDKVCYSLLAQYTPPPSIEPQFPELATRIRAWDYDLLVDHALELGVTSSFMQEPGSDSADYTPHFDLTGVG